jgi:hypothetical protein
MGIWSKLLNAEQGIRKRIEKAFGYDAERVSQDVRREIYDRIESKIIMEAGGKSFPYEKAVIRLQPTSKAMQSAFEKAFLYEESLKADVLQRLKEAQVRYPDGFGMVVELREPDPKGQANPSQSSLFRLDFVKSNSLNKKEIPETYLTVSKGQAEQSAYRLKRERILIGRLPEVMDREGRLVRKNDVVFLDNDDDVNSTVGRTHARIWFDSEKQEFRIMDEISRYGTRILRNGRSLEIPGGNPRGVRLRSGDEIFCGQACIRFELTTVVNAAKEPMPASPPQDIFNGD